MFQDLITRKMTDHAKKRESLYYLVIKEQGKIQVHQIKGNTGKEELWIMHERLGHPIFFSLGKLCILNCVSTSIFLNCNEKSVSYPKSHHISYTLSKKRGEIPFSHPY